MDTTITIVTSTALASIIVKLLDVWQKRKERKDLLEDKDTNKALKTLEENGECLAAVKTGVMMLLYDKFECMAELYLCAGRITLKQAKVLTSMYNTYKALGGDGWADDLMEKVKELPLYEESH